MNLIRVELSEWKDSLYDLLIEYIILTLIHSQVRVGQFCIA